MTKICKLAIFVYTVRLMCNTGHEPIIQHVYYRDIPQTNDKKTRKVLSANASVTDSFVTQKRQENKHNTPANAFAKHKLAEQKQQSIENEDKMYSNEIDKEDKQASKVIANSHIEQNSKNNIEQQDIPLVPLQSLESADNAYNTQDGVNDRQASKVTTKCDDAQKVSNDDINERDNDAKIPMQSKNDNTSHNNYSCYVMKIRENKKLAQSASMVNLRKIGDSIYSFCTDIPVQNIRNNPAILHIEKDTTYYGQSVQLYPPKHIRNLTMYTNSFFNNTVFENTIMSYLPFKYIYNFFFGYYSYTYSGKGVDVYIVDSNVDTNHTDIKGRVVNMFGHDNSTNGMQKDSKTQSDGAKLNNSTKSNSQIFINAPEQSISLGNLGDCDVDMTQSCMQKNQKDTSLLDNLFVYVNKNTMHASRLIDNNASGSMQCKNHGSTVATTIGGKIGGLAKDADMYVLNMLDCNNTVLLSNLLAALTHIPVQEKTVVLCLPLSGPKSYILNDYLDDLSTKNVIIVTAAGNNSDTACNFSPGSAKNVINVGALDQYAQISRFSNFGGCVRIYTIGENIVSESAVKKVNVSGTSFSSAIVAGAIAIYLESEPYAKQNDVWKFLTSNAKMSSGSYLIQKLPKVANTAKPIEIQESSESGWFGLFVVIFYLVFVIALIVVIVHLLKRRRRQRLRM